MTPVLLFLLFVSLTAIPVDANEEGEQIDTSLDTSEAIARANEGTTTRLIHDDIMPNAKRNAVPCTARGCKWPKVGNHVQIPVSISSEYTTNEKNIIIRALVTFHKSTCIRFVWRRWTDRDFLSFFSGSGCWSYLGRQGGKQYVSLKKDGCLYTGIVQHEVLHALGFHHEQVRSDRDQHVNILFHNIQEGKESNFRKVDTNNLATPYDFESVMHYSKYAFSKNWQPTIVAKRDPNLNFGQATSMSTNDIARSATDEGAQRDSSSDTSVVIARANEGITTRLIHGDIVPNMKRNADPCTATGCKWPKRGRYVIIPVVISRSYTRRERITIIRGLVSFYRKTCIRFVRKNGGITVISTSSLDLGTESNFQKVNTNNLGTPYDFQSVMHYSNYAFSKNGQPTIVAKSDPNLVFGRAESMSDNDIARKQKSVTGGAGRPSDTRCCKTTENVLDV
ncbi:hypothetical protein INR49_022826 [Caranx melampygus]|nr:hypothetical protein INR49_022826 [Caranx melampygus]